MSRSADGAPPRSYPQPQPHHLNMQQQQPRSLSRTKSWSAKFAFLHPHNHDQTHSGSSHRRRARSSSPPAVPPQREPCLKEARMRGYVPQQTIVHPSTPSPLLLRPSHGRLLPPPDALTSRRKREVINSTRLRDGLPLTYSSSTRSQPLVEEYGQLGDLAWAGKPLIDDDDPYDPIATTHVLMTLIDRSGAQRWLVYYCCDARGRDLSGFSGVDADERRGRYSWATVEELRSLRVEVVKVFWNAREEAFVCAVWSESRVHRESVESGLGSLEKARGTPLLASSEVEELESLTVSELEVRVPAELDVGEKKRVLAELPE